MNKKLKLFLITALTFSLSGCKTVDDIKLNMKEMKLYKQFKKADVHTEQELFAYAEECIIQKYGIHPIYTESTFDVDNKTGKNCLDLVFYDESNPNIYATCRVYEPNGFVDNYRKAYYEEDIRNYYTEFLNLDPETSSVVTNCSMSAELPNENETFKDFLNKEDTNVYITIYADFTPESVIQQADNLKLYNMLLEDPMHSNVFIQVLDKTDSDVVIFSHNDTYSNEAITTRLSEISLES